jgi:hypothetical protein
VSRRVASSGPNVFPPLPDADPRGVIWITGSTHWLKCRFASNCRIDPNKRWVEPDPEILPVRLYQSRPLAADPYQLGGPSDEERVRALLAAKVPTPDEEAA